MASKCCGAGSGVSPDELCGLVQACIDDGDIVLPEDVDSVVVNANGSVTVTATDDDGIVTTHTFVPGTTVSFSEDCDGQTITIDGVDHNIVYPEHNNQDFSTAAEGYQLAPTVPSTPQNVANFSPAPKGSTVTDKYCDKWVTYKTVDCNSYVVDCIQDAPRLPDICETVSAPPEPGDASDPSLNTNVDPSEYDECCQPGRKWEKGFDSRGVYIYRQQPDCSWVVCRTQVYPVSSIDSAIPDDGAGGSSFTSNGSIADPVSDYQQWTIQPGGSGPEVSSNESPDPANLPQFDPSETDATFNQPMTDGTLKYHRIWSEQDASTATLLSETVKVCYEKCVVTIDGGGQEVPITAPISYPLIVFGTTISNDSDLQSELDTRCGQGVFDIASLVTGDEVCGIVVRAPGNPPDNIVAQCPPIILGTPVLSDADAGKWEVPVIVGVPVGTTVDWSLDSIDGNEYTASIDAGTDAQNNGSGSANAWITGTATTGSTICLFKKDWAVQEGHFVNEHDIYAHNTMPVTGLIFEGGATKTTDDLRDLTLTMAPSGCDKVSVTFCSGSGWTVDNTAVTNGSGAANSSMPNTVLGNNLVTITVGSIVGINDPGMPTGQAGNPVVNGSFVRFDQNGDCNVYNFEATPEFNTMLAASVIPDCGLNIWNPTGSDYSRTVPTDTSLGATRCVDAYRNFIVTRRVDGSQSCCVASGVYRVEHPTIADTWMDVLVRTINAY